MYNLYGHFCRHTQYLLLLLRRCLAHPLRFLARRPHDLDDLLDLLVPRSCPGLCVLPWPDRWRSHTQAQSRPQIVPKVSAGCKRFFSNLHHITLYNITRSKLDRRPPSPHGPTFPLSSSSAPFPSPFNFLVRLLRKSMSVPTFQGGKEGRKNRQQPRFNLFANREEGKREKEMGESPWGRENCFFSVRLAAGLSRKIIWSPIRSRKNRPDSAGGAVGEVFVFPALLSFHERKLSKIPNSFFITAERYLVQKHKLQCWCSAQWPILPLFSHATLPFVFRFLNYARGGVTKVSLSLLPGPRRMDIP